MGKEDDYVALWSENLDTYGLTLMEIDIDLDPGSELEMSLEIDGGAAGEFVLVRWLRI